MANVTLTAEQIKKVIFSSLYYYSSFNNPIDLNTAHDIAEETLKLDFFEGVTSALGIIYPIPVEPEEPEPEI